MSIRRTIDQLKNCYRNLVLNFRGWKKYNEDTKRYNEMLKRSSDTTFRIRANDTFPVYLDMFKEAGNIDPHYFLQDITMAREIIKNAPKEHFDIGSRVDGFIAHLLCSGVIEKIFMIDVRPLSVEVEGLSFKQADATSLEGIEDESIESLSSLHAIEHFGLGRYGDPIDPDSWKKALLSMQKKLKSGGMLYFSVPVGPKNKLCFNAHRIFAPSTIVSTLDKCELVSFKFIHNMKVNEMPEKCLSKADVFMSEYDCGLFVFRKK